ncbi:hypothetical protein DAEQUDRAFT_179913 [Daedalea quercina L-15889]|uniref:Uncharacterized protein n=1 Tax=Daedalea quercina L-15889 TaxID=1314783 RepID=A0A165REE4_9APHY|nr:hypothetical protein DAEQUDRAFT_179913 [Daedalea quercina L-15889]
MVLVHEKADERPEPTNTLKIDIGGEGNMFHVSPVSPVAPALPIPPLASETFRALSDDIPDSEDERVPSRHAKPIPIKSGLHRAGSSRLKYEDPAARSLPRSLIDVHMASCSSSPSVSNLHAAIWERRADAGPSGQDSLNLTRYIDSLDMTEEERQVRRRAQLQEVLHDPTVKTSSISGSGAPSSIHCTPAPVIPPPPPTRSNTVRWASEAAKAAERARAASIHTSSSHSLSQAYFSPTSPSASRTTAPRTPRTPSPTSYTSATRPPSPTRSPVSATRLRPQQMRTASTDSLKAMRIPANASGLTRTFLVQEAHAQRVS